MPAYDDAKLRAHLEGMGIGVTIIERIEGLIQEYQTFMGISPEFVFVENPINNAGSVEFSNLILVNGKMYTEFSLTNPNDTIAFLNIPENVNRIIIPIVQEFPLSRITSRSRLTVQIFKGTESIAFFVASGNNCADLLEMVKRYFVSALNP
jgi:hypothetical protein